VPSFNLRRFDTQARVGLALSLLATACLLVTAALILTADAGFKYFSFKDLTVTYGPYRYKLILLSGLVTVILGLSGFGFGLNSAGQRRNDKPGLSWISFFIGAAVMCLAIVMLFFFYKQGQPAMMR
jgi:hypothetical protein